MLTPFFNPALHASPKPILPGMWCWQDASDSSSITLESGGRVTEWRDKSGNGRHASAAASATHRPYYGARMLNDLPVVDLQGSQWMGYPYTGSNPAQSGDATIMILAKSDNTASSTCLFHSRDTDTFAHALGVLMLVNNSSMTLRTFVNEAALDSNIGTSASSDPHVFGLLRTGATQKALLDHLSGSPAAAVNSTPSGPALLGARYNNGNYAILFDGFIAEVLIYARALDSAEIAHNLAYLENKWNL